jgi:hypothetical protein
MKLSILGLVSTSLLTVALLLFVAFHFLPPNPPAPDQAVSEVGWEIWPEIWDLLQDPEQLSEPLTAVGLSSFLTFSLLIVSSPFLGFLWRKSRIAWWGAFIFSGLAAAGFWLMIVAQDTADDLGSGGWCLLAAPVFNCVGLLVADRRIAIPREPTPGT